MVCVNGSSVDSGDGVLNITGLIEGIGVDGNLHVIAVGSFHSRADSLHGRAPVLVDLEAHRARFELAVEVRGIRTVTFGEETDVDRKLVSSLEHLAEVPGAGSDGGSVCTVCGADTAADKGCDTVGERVDSLLG